VLRNGHAGPGDYECRRGRDVECFLPASARADDIDKCRSTRFDTNASITHDASEGVDLIFVDAFFVPCDKDIPKQSFVSRLYQLIEKM
jgi:hypothetical protein